MAWRSAEAHRGGNQVANDFSSSVSKLVGACTSMSLDELRVRSPLTLNRNPSLTSNRLQENRAHDSRLSPDFRTFEGFRPLSGTFGHFRTFELSGLSEAFGGFRSFRSCDHVFMLSEAFGGFRTAFGAFGIRTIVGLADSCTVPTVDILLWLHLMGWLYTGLSPSAGDLDPARLRRKGPASPVQRRLGLRRHPGLAGKEPTK